MTIETNARLWAKLSELKPGDILIPDGRFTCMEEGTTLEVKEDKSGLYIDCRHAGHYLVGQADDGEHLVGLYPEASRTHT